MESVARSSILGALDGTITSFAVIAGAVAGELNENAVYIVGAASIAADGLSMAIAEYISVDETPYAWRSALACFVSFVLFGAIPLLAFAAGDFLATVILSLTSLMLISYARTRLGKGLLLKSMVKTVGLGVVAGLVAYGVGFVANYLM